MLEHKGVLLVAAGGTIAAEPYDKTPQYVTVRSNERVIEFLRKKHLALRVVDFATKDSKDITPDDIAEMADIIAAAAEDVVLITHGTDAMARNAQALKTMLGPVLEEKTIIVTGAMKPLSHGEGSDGYDNLEDSLRFALSEEVRGVWLVMHDKVLNPARAVKDYEKLTFYEV